MNRFRIAGQAIALVTLAALTAMVLPRGYAAFRTLSVRNDPGELSERLLDGRFDAPRATREIESALAAGDPDLAASFVALARDRGVAPDPQLLAKVDAGTQASRSVAGSAKGFMRGLVTGIPDGPASLAGTVAGDLFVFGDVRDAAREGWHAGRGEEVDKAVLGLSLAGIAITAATYATLGAGAPARFGLSLLKAAERTGELGGRLARLLRFGRSADVVRVAGDLGRIEAKAGARAAIEALKIVEGPKDVERAAKLAAKQGSKTRAVIKLLGRGAIMLGSAAFELASWMFWALLNLFALCAALKRAAERATLRVIRWRKARRTRWGARPAASPAVA